MGKKKAPAPKVTYAPPPPPPTIVQTPTQAVRTESALSEVAQAQQRLNMELGAQLDRTNEEFFAGQDIRRTQAVGAETRLGQQVAGEEERAGIRETGSEQRQTNLQSEMFRRYKEDRDYQQAQRQYRV